MTTKRTRFGFYALCIGLLSLGVAACSGGGGGTPTAAPPSPAPIALPTSAPGDDQEELNSNYRPATYNAMGGNDEIAFSGGMVGGNVLGGAGNDTIILSGSQLSMAKQSLDLFHFLEKKEDSSLAPVLRSFWARSMQQPAPASCRPCVTGFRPTARAILFRMDDPSLSSSLWKNLNA